MKIGDYVRFDYHRVSVPIQIAKITEIHYDSEDDSNCYSTDIGLVIDESNLVKEPSLNIIELIEVGDYVNGHRVIDIAKDQIRALYYEDINQKYALIPMINKDIKSIVTKEQFEAIKYEIK